MAKVTYREVMEFKNSLKQKFNEVFEVKSFDSLSKKEKSVYRKYRFNDATAIYEDQAYNSLKPEEKEIYDGLMVKLDGKKANCLNTRKALAVLKDAYKHHMEHEKPAWYHFFDRYTYWKESKAIQSFEEKLVEKGIAKEKMESTKNEVKELYTYTRSNALDGDEIEIISPVNQNQITVDFENDRDEDYEEYEFTNEDVKNMSTYIDNVQLNN